MSIERQAQAPLYVREGTEYKAPEHTPPREQTTEKVNSGTIVRGKSGGGNYRGKHRSQTKGKGLEAFFRDLWMPRYRR